MEGTIPVEHNYPPKPDELPIETSRFNPLRTLVSLLIYIAVYYALFRDLKSVLLLVIVIFIHESGHFIAMKYFGYSDVKMFFVPLLGAFVSGEAREISQSKRAIMLLAGPVPGVILGVICLWIYTITKSHVFYQFAILFLFLNVFNLLPVSPMDGGQLLETLYMHSNRMIQTIFIVLSSIAIAFAAFSTHNYFILIILVLLLSRLTSLYRYDKLRRLISSKGINLQKIYEDLSDKEYWEIRKELIKEVPSLKKYDQNQLSGDESEVISWVKAVLMKKETRPLSFTEKTVFTLIWLVAMVGPVLYWLNYTLSFYLAE